MFPIINANFLTRRQVIEILYACDTYGAEHIIDDQWILLKLIAVDHHHTFGSHNNSQMHFVCSEASALICFPHECPWQLH